MYIDYRSQRGFSLVELAIASFLASMLVVVLVQLYHQLQQDWHRVAAQSSISQRQRFIRLYWQRQWHFQPGQTLQVQGYDVAPPAYWRRQRLAGQSMLLLRRCRLGHCEVYGWFVASTRRKDRAGQRIDGLYRKKTGGRREELIDGVVAMHLSYGAMSSGKLAFLPAAKVLNWSTVSVIKVWLLLRSLQPLPHTDKRIWFAGRWLDHSSRYLEQSWVMVLRLKRAVGNGNE